MTSATDLTIDDLDDDPIADAQAAGATFVTAFAMTGLPPLGLVAVLTRMRDAANDALYLAIKDAREAGAKWDEIATWSGRSAEQCRHFVRQEIARRQGHDAIPTGL